MALKPLKEQTFKETEVSLLMSVLREWANQFQNIPFLDGRLISDLILDSADSIKVSHNLGRQPKGWFVVDQDADANIYETDRTESGLFLKASSTVTASVWVF